MTIQADYTNIRDTSFETVLEVNQPYEQQLPDEVRKSLSMMAISIKKSADEVRQAALNKTHIGRRAEDFLDELEQEKS